MYMERVIWEFPYYSVYFKAWGGWTPRPSKQLNFHTIQSILKLVWVFIEDMKGGEFPYYSVYFKALPEDTGVVLSLRFPYYSVYFKARALNCSNPFSVRNFHTIQSILKLAGLVWMSSSQTLFPYYSVYFKAQPFRSPPPLTYQISILFSLF